MRFVGAGVLLVCRRQTTAQECQLAHCGAVRLEFGVRASEACSQVSGVLHEFDKLGLGECLCSIVCQCAYNWGEYTHTFTGAWSTCVHTHTCTQTQGLAPLPPDETHTQSCSRTYVCVLGDVSFLCETSFSVIAHVVTRTLSCTHSPVHWMTPQTTCDSAEGVVVAQSPVVC